MTDDLTKKQRSYCMSRIRSKNTGIEKVIFKLLNAKGIKYKKHYNLIGKPDIAFSDIKLAVFLDSDYWHGWQFPRWKNRLPKKYWRNKIEYNIKRYRNNSAKLKRRGWKVLRIWSHQIENDPEGCAGRIIKEALRKNGRRKR